jgi:hypothetical protein
MCDIVGSWTDAGGSWTDAGAISSISRPGAPLPLSL